MGQFKDFIENIDKELLESSLGRVYQHTQEGGPVRQGGGGNYVVKSFSGRGRPYHEQKREVLKFDTEGAARAAAKKIKGSDRVVIQFFDGKKWNILDD